MLFRSGVADLSQNEMAVFTYPNPASTSIYISSRNGSRENAIVSLISSEGKLLHQQQLVLQDVTEIKLPLSARNASLIFLQIQCNNRTETKKVMILK